MKIKGLFLLFIFISATGSAVYAQITDIHAKDSVQHRIHKVENNLRPLVLSPGASLWNLEKQMQQYNIPGLSVAVIHNYKIDWAKGYGVTGNTESPEITERTAFQAASMSKFVNAVAMLNLIEQKNLSLDEDINTYLTSWKFTYHKKYDETPIRIRQLLSHTAGLSIHGFAGYKNANKLPSIIEILEGNKPANSDRVEQLFASQTKFKYSGGGTTIAQLILTDQSNTSYENFLNKNIFQPLGMSNSFYSIESDRYPRDMAYGHAENGDVLKNQYNLYPESAAAGLWTTPTDLAKFIIDIQLSLASGKGKILSQQSTSALIKPSLENSNSALGLFTEYENGTLYLQHSGSNEGFRGKFYFSGEHGNGVVILINGTNTKIIEEIIRSVAYVYQWTGFKSFEAKEELNLNDLDLEKYTGTYILDDRAVHVILKKGKLILKEKGKWSSGLTPLTNSKFVVDIVKPRATIEFITSTDGTVSKSKLQQGETTEWVKKK